MNSLAQNGKMTIWVSILILRFPLCSLGHAGGGSHTPKLRVFSPNQCFWYCYNWLEPQRLFIQVSSFYRQKASSSSSCGNSLSSLVQTFNTSHGSSYSVGIFKSHFPGGKTEVPGSSIHKVVSGGAGFRAHLVLHPMFSRSPSVNS